MFRNRTAGINLASALRLRAYGLIFIFLVLILVIVFSTFVGSVRIPMKEVIQIYWNQLPFLPTLSIVTQTHTAYEIIVFLREPEVLGGVVVGIALGVGGATIQSIFRNPITEPYVIGISGGASLGAVMSIVLGIAVFGLYTVQALAFLFSVLAVGTIYIFSYRRGTVNPTYLLLIGIAISFFFSSLVALLLFSNINLQGEAFFWLLGSLQNITWAALFPVSGIVLISSFVLGSLFRELNSLQLGEAHARSVGVNIERTKAISIIMVTLSVSAAVSISGLIGFVGLIMPHVSRIMFGGSNKYVIPASGMLGAIFLLLADDLARSVVVGVVIPVGIITGMIGVPFFLYLMRRLAFGKLEN